MIKKVLDWLTSDKNIFTMLGCIFEIMRAPEHAEVQSVTIDFDLNNYFCRLTFWDSGQGHMEVLNSETEETVIDEAFDAKSMMNADKPFEELAKKLAD